MTTALLDRRVWTILSVINWWTAYLERIEIDSPRLTVELILARVLGCSRIDLYKKFHQPLHPKELGSLKEMFRRRVAREPLQYILGDTEFMGLHFFVDRRVLVPRPETEVLVEQAIREVRDKNTARVLDVGTGSGNIAVSLALAVTTVMIDALDVSGRALAVAEENIRFHAVADRVRTVRVDIFDDGFETSLPTYDLIVSNPPYVSKKEFEHLAPEIREYEPPMATTDNGDGLTFYRRIARLGKSLLQEHGAIFVEVGYGQAEGVAGLFTDAGYTVLDAVRDYQNIDRVLKVSRAA